MKSAAHTVPGMETCSQALLLHAASTPQLRTVEAAPRLGSGSFQFPAVDVPEAPFKAFVFIHSPNMMTSCNYDT
eukprot:962427-Pelagomonas_calceolata.AAC.3